MEKNIYQQENVHEHFNVTQVLNDLKWVHAQIFTALNHLNNSFILTYLSLLVYFLFFKEPRYYEFYLSIINNFRKKNSNIEMKGFIYGCKI